MKLDKDFMGKNGFWLATGLAGLLLVVMFFILFTSASAEPKKLEKQFTDKKKAFQSKSSGSFVNDTPAFIDPWNRRQSEYSTLKGKAWNVSWRPQAGLQTWPEDEPQTLGAQAQLEKSAFGSDNVTKLSQLVGHRIENYLDTYRSQLYPKQFPKLKDDKGQPITLPSGYAMAKFLYPKQRNGSVNWPITMQGGLHSFLKPVEWDKDIPPTVEEAWLAQEDIWLRRGMLKIVLDSMRSVAQCKPLLNPTTGKNDWPIPKDRKGDFVKRCRFQNMHWELDILIEKYRGKPRISAQSTIKNISPSKRPRPLVHGSSGLQFIIRQERQAPLVMKPIVGVILSHGQSTEFGVSTSSTTINFTKEFFVEQYFTLATTPIKSLLAMEVGTDRAKDHRTFVVDLKRPSFSPKVKTATGGGQFGQGGGQFGQGGGQMGEMGGYPTGDPSSTGTPGGGVPGAGIPGGGGKKPDSAADSLTRNKLVRNRYLMTNDQVRRIPVAIALVLEQPYKEDFLTAVANSNLKIQITQVLWRYRPDFDPLGSITTSPATEIPSSGGTGGNEGGVPVGGFPTGDPSGGGLPPGSAPPGSLPPGSAPPGSGGEGGPPPGWRDHLRGGPFIPGDLGGQYGLPQQGKDPKAPTDTARKEKNLIELTVYGIATLYERPDAKKKKPNETGLGN